MTTPLVHDYPDWSRSSAQADIKVMRTTAVVINALTNYGPFFVGNLPYLELFFASTLTKGRWTLQWFSDAAMTEDMGSDRFTTTIGAQVDLHVPIGGPWLRVVAEGDVYPATLSTQIYMSAVPRVKMRENAGGPPILISDTAIAIGAGAIITRDAVQVVPGLAVWCVDSDLATWTARLQGIDVTGALVRVASMRGNPSPGPAMVFLPPQPCRISVTNTTGVAGTVDVQLVSHSLLGA